MSDQVDVHEEHVWAQENIAAYVVGGLDPAERDRLETHAADCAVCRLAIDETRAVERKMAACFTAADPGPALEDRMIHALPSVVARRLALRMSGKGKVLLVLAASLVLAVVGAGVRPLINDDFLRFPGPSRVHVANNLKQMGVAFHDQSESMLGAKRQGGETEGAPALKSASELAAEAMQSDLSVRIKRGDELTAFTGTGVSQDRDRVSGDGRAATRLSERGPSVKETPTPPAPAAGFIAPTLRPHLTLPAASEPSSGPVIVGGAGVTKDSPFNTLQVPGSTSAGTGLAAGVSNPYSGGAGGLGAGQGGYNQPATQPATSPYLRFQTQFGMQTYFKPGDDLGRVAQEIKKIGDKAVQDLTKNPKDAAQDPKIASQDTKTSKPLAEQPAAPETSGRKIIRSGDIEFEIDSFDNSVSLIMRLVTATKGGFVATINSDKLANGKVRGSIVVRVPPEQLDKFILDLRKELGKHGELKNQRIGSQDITKQYTDIESRLRAARTMEERLLHIIKEGKGAIKDLLQAEKELGVWRTKIEEMEGELRYYSNLVAHSTLTISLYEKDIRVAAAVTESERVQTGIEVEDVEKAHQEALKAITDFKGRVARSELKQHAAGQFNALLHFEVSPEATGPMRDRLKQLGTMVRLQIDRVQQTQGGGPAPKEGKVERGPTLFIVDIYNLANVAPRETVFLRIASSDVPGEYLKLRELVSKTRGRVINAQLNQQERQNIGAQLDFDVRRATVGEVQAALTEAGETLSRQVNRVPENDNVTDSKVQYRLVLVDAAAIPPRENVILRIAASDVPAAFQKLVEALGKAKARVHKADLNEQDRRNITAVLAFDLSRTEQAGVQAALTAAGEVLSRQANRQQESNNVTDARVAFQVDLSPADAIAPRESTMLALEAQDVTGTLALFTAQVKEARGRILGSPEIAQTENGQVTGRATFDVPLSAAGSLVERFKIPGQLRVYKMTPNPQAPDGKLALARIDVTVSNAPLLLPSDQGLWSQIRGGLAFSLRGLSISASWLIVGLLFVLPWALVIYVVVLLARRLFRGVAMADAGTGISSTTPPTPPVQ